MKKTRKQLIQWLKDFEDCVHAVDYDQGRRMFCAKVNCFGSFTHRATSIEHLIKKQWARIWPNIRHFHFDLKKLDIHVDAKKESACLILPWRSVGYNRNKPFKRNGRVTICLRKDKKRKRWLAYHTHYSLKPGTQIITKIKSRSK